MPRKKKGKPPAFQMYANDFITGAMTMSLAERGAYATLMCQQWDKGGIPDDPDKLARLMVCDRSEAVLIWDAIRSKFERGPDGLYRNQRIETERKKQRAFRRKQKKNGKLGGRPAGNPSLSSGLRLAKPKGNPKQSSSSSSSVFGSSTPPNPLADAKGPMRVSTRRATKAERERAEHYLTSTYGDPHTPKCASREECLGRIVQTWREQAAHGQRQVAGGTR